MEKSVKEVFNEIQTTIASLRAQLDELEEKLALMATAAPEAEESAEIEEIPETEEIDPEPEEIPDQVGDDTVVIEPEPVEIPAEEVPVEDEVIDLSIDMAEMGAKTVPDAKSFQWMIDLPGSPVANVISAISLNDRVLFINTLFKEDPSLFQQTIAAFNGMQTINEAVSYVIANFPDWNLNSEVVYRLMMAVRRKLS